VTIDIFNMFRIAGSSNVELEVLHLNKKILLSKKQFQLRMEDIQELRNNDIFSRSLAKVTLPALVQ